MRNLVTLMLGVSAAAPAFSFDANLIAACYKLLVFQHIYKAMQFWGEQSSMNDLVFTEDPASISYLDLLGFSDYLVLTFSPEFTLSTKIPAREAKQYSKVVDVNSL